MFDTNNARVVSVFPNDKGELEVVYRYPSMTRYGNGMQVPDKVEKHIFGVVDGKIARTKVITGTHIPAKQLQERIEFPSEELLG